MTEVVELTKLTSGMKLLLGGSRALIVDDQLAAAYNPGDALLVVEKTGDVLHVPQQELRVARDAVSRALQAFQEMRLVSDAQISQFFSEFAERLANDSIWAEIESTNAHDVARARERGRSTTRLETSEAMRTGMIEGLRGWAVSPSERGRIIETIDHGSWRAELVGAELGVVAFVFEGRPNVVADATGVLRGGNTVVFRIGSDALATAKAIVRLATEPALLSAGLPAGAVTVVDSTSHAAGWAMFSDSRLSLAVARGSGAAVDTLGSLAARAGVSVSLHGTGGAWLCVGTSASPEKLTQTVVDSLDRKVCNTLNTCCIPRSASEAFVPAFLEGLRQAGLRRSTSFKLHVARGGEELVPADLFETKVVVGRAEGDVEELQAELIAGDQLGHEWEWEKTPEVTLKIVEDLSESIALFNEQSPQFVACLLSEDSDEHEQFYQRVNAPFVGDGFTRWVDGQYALRRPELGLSNWEKGRLFGRGGVLSGDSVHTIRTRVVGTSSGKPRA